MKTSADTYYKDSNKFTPPQPPLGKGGNRGGGLSLVAGRLLLILTAVFISSCAARYGTVSRETTEASPASPVERHAEKPAEKGKQTYAFQELTGDKKLVVASWYGPDFHGKPTSSGEPFNMYALTCAHKEYPFGTRLKVVSTISNKEVECIVNDRGPFIAGRDLDLSYSAAKKIDLVGPGTSTVMIEPVGRDMRYVKYIRYGTTGGTLTIQVGSFREESNAKRLRMALELKYRNVYVMEADVGGVKYFRVRLGKFTSKNDAAGTGKSLADEGYNVLITKYEQQI